MQSGSDDEWGSADVAAEARRQEEVPETEIAQSFANLMKDGQGIPEVNTTYKCQIQSLERPRDYLIQITRIYAHGDVGSKDDFRIQYKIRRTPQGKPAHWSSMKEHGGFAAQDAQIVAGSMEKHTLSSRRGGTKRRRRRTTKQKKRSTRNYTNKRSNKRKTRRRKSRKRR
jgi:hypothetical protein